MEGDVDLIEVHGLELTGDGSQVVSQEVRIHRQHRSQVIRYYLMTENAREILSSTWLGGLFLKVSLQVSGWWKR